MGLEAMLYMALIVLIFLVLTLIVVFFVIKNKEKQNEQNEAEETDMPEKTTTKSTGKTKLTKEYDVKSIFDFMEFETVKDNMIVQKGGKRFLMAIECKGINYDLLSEVEMAATEQGFASFLNAVKEPIQIYIQTRTINLEKNIISYKDRIEKIKDQLNIKEYRLKQYEEKDNIDEKILKDKQMEVLREKNLYTYGQDVIADTKKMSLNKNVLKKKYYIIMKYFYEASDDSPGTNPSEDEIRDTAFSNLYTQASSLISVLSGIGVIGRALNSYELVELLYNAYNRDDSEIFNVENAIQSGYNEIYIDSQSIIDKKINALNNEIQLKSQERAKKAIEDIMDERAEELKNIEENIDSIIEDLAKQLIENENQNNIPAATKKKAIEKIEKESKKKGEKEADVKKGTKETNSKRRAS